MGKVLACFGVCAAVCFAQLPQITPGGVVNSGSWSAPVSPGALASVFGSNLASKQQAAAPPYPLSLGGTSVTVNGVAAPLIFVSPGQINFQMPSAVANTQWFTITGANIVVTTAAGSSAPYAFGVGSQPGLFTLSGAGCGQAAALNIRADGSVSINSPSNSAAPGDYVALFGTGLGFSSTQPADGAGATGPARLQTAPGLMLDESLLPPPPYAGLAPTLPGVDQINFQIPAATRNGCAVPVSASAGLFSPEVTIAIQNGRGQCADPPVQSYGTITLAESTFTSSAAGSAPSTRDSFIASFPAAPGLPAPAPEKILFAPDYVADTTSMGAVEVQGPIYNTGQMRVCDVPGYTHLSAGPITIQPPSGAPITAQPVAVNPQAPGKGMTYGQALPAGSMGPGKYTITGAQFTTSIQVGSPIQLQTQFPATISSSQPLTVKWTGGDSSSLVRFSLCSTNSLEGTLCDYTYAHASDGSLTISPLCTGHSVSSGGNGVFCSWALPLSTNAQIVIDVIPSTSQTIAVSGVTGPVTVSWRYRYTFAGLTLGS